MTGLNSIRLANENSDRIMFLGFVKFTKNSAKAEFFY
jgi:hypothetical protein